MGGWYSPKVPIRPHNIREAPYFQGSIFWGRVGLGQNRSWAGQMPGSEEREPGTSDRCIGE